MTRTKKALPEEDNQKAQASSSDTTVILRKEEPEGVEPTPAPSAETIALADRMMPVENDPEDDIEQGRLVEAPLPEVVAPVKEENVIITIGGSVRRDN